jgi:hypothetical protein
MGGQLEEWVVGEAIDAAMCERVRGLLRGTLPEHVNATVTHEAPLVRVVVHVSPDEIAALATDLDDVDAPVLAAWGDWENDFEPPQGGDDYKLVVELTTKEPETFEPPEEGELSILSVYSKDGDNNEGWPTAFVLAARLARLLGAIEPENLRLAN